MTRAVTGWDGVRALRLTAFAVAATCLALGSHVIAGGRVPGALPTLVACAFPGIAGAVLTRRRRGPVDILVVLGVVQLAMHEVFAAPGEPTHAAGAMPPHCQGVGCGGAVMLLAHLVATVATAALLARGEQVVHVLMPLVDWMRRGAGWTARVVRPLPVAGRQTRPVTAVPTVPRLGLVAVADVARRGPPTLVVTVAPR
jgi:hypothetical protein